MPRFTRQILAYAAGVLVATAMTVSYARAQGCMPIRFVSPTVGGGGDAYLESGGLQMSVAYRRLFADEFFLGTRAQPTLAPRGQPIIIHNNTVDLEISYAMSSRITLAFNVPFSTGSISNVHADNVRHENEASGIGDINVRGSSWLWDPETNPRGNIALGIGVKAPTGTTRKIGSAWGPTGVAIDHPVSVAVQPGEGGWGLILQGEGYRTLTSRMFGYASAVYIANPRESVPVLRDPGGMLRIGVPDTYSVRSGVSYNLVSRGTMAIESRTVLSGSLGWRQDATTKRDLIGGKDLAFRAPAIVGYVDTGMSFVRGRYSLSVNVPIRAYQEYRRSFADETLNRQGGGNLARYLVIVELGRRF